MMVLNLIDIGSTVGVISMGKPRQHAAARPVEHP